jgi:tetratricopeptide (TPR) repeat protein
LFVLYSLLLLLLLYMRVRGGHIIYLVNAGAMMTLGLFAAIFFYYLTPVGVLGVVLILVGVGQLFVDMNLWYDFTFEQTRLRLVFERGVKGHTSFFISGRKYSELGMWGRAIIHLRRAISIDSSHITYHLALVVAYINIKRYDLAQTALKKAEQIAPNMPEIYKLQQELTARLQPAPPKH